MKHFYINVNGIVFEGIYFGKGLIFQPKNSLFTLSLTGKLYTVTFLLLHSSVTVTVADGTLTFATFFLAENSVYLLDGLKHNSYYHVRARSRNKAGLSDASNIIYLQTTKPFNINPLTSNSAVMLATVIPVIRTLVGVVIGVLLLQHNMTR